MPATASHGLNDQLFWRVIDYIDAHPDRHTHLELRTATKRSFVALVVEFSGHRWLDVWPDDPECEGADWVAVPAGSPEAQMADGHPAAYADDVAQEALGLTDDEARALFPVVDSCPAVGVAAWYAIGAGRALSLT